MIGGGAGAARGRGQLADWPWRSYGAAVIAAILWGSLYPAGKPAVAAVGSLQVAFCRAFLAALTMGVIVVVRGDGHALFPQMRTRFWGIGALALLSYFGSSVLAMAALGLLPASINGLLNNTHPLWVALGAAVLLAPRRPVLLVAGSVLALTGVALVFFPDLRFDLGSAEALNPLGVALSLVGSFVIALSTVVGRGVMRQGDPIAISALASGLAVPALGALVILNGGFAPILSADLPIALHLLWVGVGCTGANFALWFYALQRLPAAQASAFQYLIPPISVVLSALFLDEPITSGLVVGGLCIVAGLVFTQFSAATAPPRVPAPRASAGQY